MSPIDLQQALRAPDVTKGISQGRQGETSPVARCVKAPQVFWGSCGCVPKTVGSPVGALSLINESIEEWIKRSSKTIL